jgi:4-amino-4-deoxy-L-arabinose transferase-like glycosyltransferase
MARVVNVLMAGGIVITAYLIAKTLWGRAAALWAALTVLLASPVVFYARTSNLDVPALFWTSLGCLVAIRILTLGMTRRRGILLGVAAALAVATKDQTYGALVPGLIFLALAVLWPLWRAEGRAGVKQAWRHLVVMTLVGTAVYAVANGIVFRPSRFLLHLEFVTGFERSFFNLQHPSTLTLLRPATLAGYATLLWDILLATATSLGPLLLLAGLLGIPLAWRRSPPSRLFVWMGLGFVVLSLFPIRHMQFRYALFPAFLVALFAGYAVSWAWGQGGLRRILVGVVLVFGVGWQVLTALDLTYQMLFDARYRAGDWLARTAEPGDRLGYFGVRHQLPAIPVGVVPIEMREDASAIDRLTSGDMRFVVVAPDYFSDPSRERSLFLPEAIYRQLKDGTLGYQPVAVFNTPSLLHRPLPYLPYVNPTVQLFEWSEAAIPADGE